MASLAKTMAHGANADLVMTKSFSTLMGMTCMAWALVIAVPAAAQSASPESFGETTSEAIDGGNPYYVPEAEPVAPRAAPPARPAAPVEAPPGAHPGLPPHAGGPGAQKGGEFYRDCPSAWAMGKGPLFRGQPGYRPDLDPDGDGVACHPVG